MSTSTESPLLKEWNHTPHGLPPFTEIEPSQFEAALQFAMQDHIREVQVIAANTEEATFDNTIATFDRSGTLFSKVCETFENLCSSNGVPELQAVELKMAGPLAAHYNQLATIPGLFAKIDAVYNQRHALNLNSEQIRLVERFHLDFVRAGAKFSTEMQTAYGKIVEELAELSTKFTQNVMADEADVFLELSSEEDKAGLPEDLLSAAKQAAQARNLAADAHIITLSRSLVEPFLTYSTRRDLREKAWKLWTKRGELNDEKCNYPIAIRILELRAQQAKMHGYESFGDFATADTMAGNPGRVMDLLQKVWTKAKDSVGKERSELENYIRLHFPDQPVDIQPWDWRFYAEKVRCANYNLDNAEVKPYFPLNRMVEAIFDCAQQLFGLHFRLIEGLPSYHPDVQTYEVFDQDADGKERLVAIFLHDNYARPNKRSGAWMASFRVQHRNTGKDGAASVVPIIINNNNFNKPGEGEVALLSFDDAVTLFHEFGHGLHGMLSDVTYKRLSGTNVLKDFVELPSQLYEHWLSESVVLKKHARHYKTNECIPDELLSRLMKARSFNQGFQTVEYTASALVDAYLHILPSVEGLNLQDFERQTLEKLGMPSGIIMRHRLPHFQHLFSGESYASGYYVYLWAEVLDADGFEAFKETGDCFNKEVGARVRKYIYSAGNSQDPAALFRQFRGRDPVIEPMLKKKGLLV